MSKNGKTANLRGLQGVHKTCRKEKKRRLTSLTIMDLAKTQKNKVIKYNTLIRKIHELIISNSGNIEK